MIEIVCPSCQARYQLPEGSIGPEGRKVSCSSCSHKWRAYAQGAEPAETPPSYDPLSEPESPTGSPPESPYEPAPGPPASPGPQFAPEPQSAPEAPHEFAPEFAPESPPAYEPQAPVEPQSPPGMEAATSAPDPTPTIAAVESFGSDSGAPEVAPAPGNRDEQMAAIRQMLSDLKEGAEIELEPEPEEVRAPVTPPPSMRKRADEDEGDRDQLKSRIDQLSKAGRSTKGQPEHSGYDAARLRRMHEKRAKKLQRSRERRKRSGAFITGFTLVSMVAGTMVALYVLKPQIIASSPEMAPALNEYTVAVDRYRVELNDTTAEWREWLTKRIEGLTGEEAKTE